MTIIVFLIGFSRGHGRVDADPSFWIYFHSALSAAFSSFSQDSLSWTRRSRSDCSESDGTSEELCCFIGSDLEYRAAAKPSSTQPSTTSFDTAINHICLQHRSPPERLTCTSQPVRELATVSRGFEAHSLEDLEDLEDLKSSENLEILKSLESSPESSMGSRQSLRRRKANIDGKRSRLPLI